MRSRSIAIPLLLLLWLLPAQVKSQSAQERDKIASALTSSTKSKSPNRMFKAEAIGDDKTILKFTTEEDLLKKLLPAFEANRRLINNLKNKGFHIVVFNNGAKDVRTIDLTNLPSDTNQDSAQESARPAIRLKQFAIYASSISRTFGGLQKENAKAEIDFFNGDTRAVLIIELQVDILDKLRRKISDRLFLKLEDIGFGDRSIKPGKSGHFTTDLGKYQAPDGCAPDGSMRSGSECIGQIKINRIVFKDRSIWERPGWKDEPNPNNR
jgi:hypothetical protein